jgi:FkbM family methyltransferase
MIDDIEQYDGFWWPKKDKICRPYTLNEKEMPNDIVKLLGDGPRRTVIQAGGNVGYYASIYSKLFDTVYTFEPDHINFLCLVLNTTDNNIIKMQACLGDNNNPLSIETDVSSPFNFNDEAGNSQKIFGLNAGGYYVNGSGIIPSLTIDSLNLTNVDLIHLDTEGYEGPILSGAINTITAFKPLIVVELGHGHGKRYKWPKGAIGNFLNNLGYSVTAKFGADCVFTYTGKTNDV